MKALSIILNTLVIGVVALVAALSLATMLPIPGKVQVKIVQSGSMEPVLHTGSIVVIHPEASYAVGDIVTFGADTPAHAPTTHRILSARTEGSQLYFTTKGDANEDADSAEAPASSVIGRVLFTVPYLGYLIDFARKPVGFVLLVVVPAALIVLYEAWSIIEELQRRKRPRARVAYMSQRPRSEGSENTSKVIRSLALIIASTVAGITMTGGTLSYFADTEGSAENQLSSSILDFSVDVDATHALSLTLEGEGEGSGTSFTPFITESEGTLPFSYGITAEVTGGDPVLCDALQLKGSAPLFDYDGPLRTLTTPTTSDPSPWPVMLYLPEGSLSTNGALCMVDLVYRGSQEGAEEGSEYHDEERLSLLVTYQGESAPSARSAPPTEGAVQGTTIEETPPSETPSEEVPSIEPENTDTPVEPAPVEALPPSESQDI